MNQVKASTISSIVFTFDLRLTGLSRVSVYASITALAPLNVMITFLISITLSTSNLIIIYINSLFTSNVAIFKKTAFHVLSDNWELTHKRPYSLISDILMLMTPSCMFLLIGLTLIYEFD